MRHTGKFCTSHQTSRFYCNDISIYLWPPCVDTKSDRRPSLRPKCGGSYDPSTVSYNLSISWTLNDPIVLETVEQYRLSLTPLHSNLIFSHLTQQSTERSDVRIFCMLWLYTWLIFFYIEGADRFCAFFQLPSCDKQISSGIDGEKLCLKLCL